MTIKRDARREAIIATGRDAFLRNGFADTSMSHIAATLGGSKTTLWSYFPNKADLFIAVADDLVQEYIVWINGTLEEAQCLQTSLQHYGTQLIAALSSPQIDTLIRIVSGEAKRMPQLGELFHERGLGRGWLMLKAFFDGAVERGQIRGDCDTLVAAQHFMGLCKAGAYQRFMLGGSTAPDSAAIAADVRAATDIFLRAYAVAEARVPDPAD